MTYDRLLDLLMDIKIIIIQKSQFFLSTVSIHKNTVLAFSPNASSEILLRFSVFLVDIIFQGDATCVSFRLYKYYIYLLGTYKKVGKYQFQRCTANQVMIGLSKDCVWKC